MLQIPAVLDSYRSMKDRTLKLTFETNEPSPEQMAMIQKVAHNAGYLAFNEDMFTSDQIKQLGDIKVDYDDTSKTPSKRLRAVLYLLWQKNSQDFDTAQRYYDHYMEKIILHYKKQIDE